MRYPEPLSHIRYPELSPIAQPQKYGIGAGIIGGTHVILCAGFIAFLILVFQALF